MTEAPSSTTQPSPLDPTESEETEVQLVHHKKNFIFLAAALMGVFVLFAVVGAFMSRSANLHSVEKQREYNEEYDSLTPSTSQNRDMTDVQEVDAVVMEDLDPQLDEIDSELNKL